MAIPGKGLSRYALIAAITAVSFFAIGADHAPAAELTSSNPHVTERGGSVEENDTVDANAGTDTSVAADIFVGTGYEIMSITFKPPTTGEWKFKLFPNSTNYVDVIPTGVDALAPWIQSQSETAIEVRWNVTNIDPSAEGWPLTAEGNLKRPSGGGGGGGVPPYYWASIIETPSIEIHRDEDGGAVDYKALTENQSVVGKTLSDALPGQKMNLKCIATLPGGRTITSYSWEIDGVIFKDWRAHQTQGILDEMAAGDLDDETVHFYWTNDGSHDVKLTVTLDDGIVLEKEETLEIAKPDVTFGDVGDIGKSALGESNLSGGITFKPALGLFSTGGTRIGAPNLGGTPSEDGNGYGIVFTGQVKLPAGWPRDYGKWNWVQLITLDRYIVDGGGGLGGGVSKKTSGNGTEYLDTSYPYAPANSDDELPEYPEEFGDPAGAHDAGDGASDEHTTTDTPHRILETNWSEVLIGNEKFRMWIMFRPSGDNSRYVPTKMIRWQWGGKSVKEFLSWDPATNAHQSRTASYETTEHPVWTDNAKNHLGYVANGDPAITVSFTNADVTEGDGTVTGKATVSVPANVGADLTINLSTSNPARLTVPATVTIASGTKSVGFDYTVVDNADVDGDEDVLTFGQATAHTSGSDSIGVKDNDP